MFLIAVGAKMIATGIGECSFTNSEQMAGGIDCVVNR
jgi:predicted flavoprotein YhiN